MSEAACQRQRLYRNSVRTGAGADLLAIFEEVTYEPYQHQPPVGTCPTYRGRRHDSRCDENYEISEGSNDE